MQSAVSGLVSKALSARLDGRDPKDTTAPAAPVPAADPADWRDGWFVFMVPDISDEAAAKITAAGAWPAYTAFFRLLWKRQREAEKAGNAKALAACKAGVLLDDGIRGLARSIGLSPKAMNRQMDALRRLGFMVVAKPPAALDRSANGRIVRRPTHRGLVPASKVRFMASEDHKRPGNRQGFNRPLRVVGERTPQGSDRPLKGGRLKGRSDTTPISPKNISPPTGGHADGIGRPVGAGNGRLTAAEPPTVHPWHGPEEAARRAMLARLEAERAERDARDREAAERDRAARQAAASTPPAAPPPAPPRDATEAAGRLEAAVAALPAGSMAKAKRVARSMAKADRKAAKDAKALQDLIERRRREEAGERQAKADGTKAKARAAFRAAKGSKREQAPVPA